MSIKKSLAVKSLIEHSKKLSEDNDGLDILEYTVTKRNGGKGVGSRQMNTFNIKAINTLNSIINNIKQLYDSLPANNKGFTFSNSTYYSSRQISIQNIFNLDKYRRNISPSRSKITPDVVNLVYQYVNNHSVSISIPRRRSSGLTDVVSVRHFTNTKKYIYKKLKNDHPDIKLKNAKFHKLCPKTYVKPKKWTDMCNVCVAGKKVIKTRASGINQDLDIILQQENAIREYEEHIQLANKQRASSVYYNRTSISDLFFCLITKTNGEIKRRYYNYMSRFLAYNSKYTVNCLTKLINSDYISNYKNVYLWSDAGTHFRSNEYIYEVFETILKKFTLKTFYLNYFLECYGKGDVYGHFGVLAKWFYEIENTRNILTFEELIKSFKDKVSEQASIYKVTSKEIGYYFIEYEGQDRSTPINSMVVKNLRTCLSFHICKTEKKLKLCPLSTMDLRDYRSIKVKTESVLDERKKNSSSQKNQSFLDKDHGTKF
ncbi:hypothetical protein BB559_007133 [Furculomyces boomerangus]|uniref:Uncharacterized protein n=1 Tax=Furculomyces boomerangus TaxID=61424 RepID=A0A2T9XYP4_9FUNG|nr:hypothetical protein BB559_007133 [Furculomyces boomerangus]